MIGSAISCKKDSQMAGLIDTVGRSILKVAF